MQEFDIIETPENVELERRLAGIGSRFIAGLVDTILIVGLYVLLLAILLFVAWWSPFEVLRSSARWQPWVLVLLILAAFSIYWGYFVFFEMVTNGQSPGKKSLKIRVVKEGGSAITFNDVAIRNLLRVVDALPVGYAAAGICMFVTKKVQRLGDLAAGTVVISEQVPDYAARSDKRIKGEWEREASAAALRATGLSPEEYRVLCSYWLRREQLTIEARQRVLPQLLRPILLRTGDKLPDESLETLEAYVALLMNKARTPERQNAPEKDSTETVS